MKEIIKIYVVA